MAGHTEKEIRALAREEFELQFSLFRDEMAAAARINAKANADIAKAVERLSLIVVGDAELRVAGLISDVEILKRIRQESLVDRAKLTGIWIGGSAVAIVVGRVLWYLLNLVLK